VTCWQPPILFSVTETAPIPSGAVTLLFTDIEGSTRLWESEPDAMAQRKLRELMGNGPFDDAHRAGCALTRAQAVELALSSESSG
jgi:hypothetical protein